MSRRRFRLSLAVLILLPIIAIVATSGDRAVAGPELITNPSMESVSPTNAALPAGWNQGRWGTNTATFSHPTGGAHTGNRFARVVVSSYSNGDAKWWFNPVPVSPSTVHTYSTWYRSTANTVLVAQVTSTSGAASWVWLANVPTASAWTRASATFTTPADAATVTVYHLLAAVGTLDTDDVSLSSGTAGPTPTTAAPTTAAPTTAAPTTAAPTTAAPTTATPTTAAPTTAAPTTAAPTTAAPTTTLPSGPFTQNFDTGTDAASVGMTDLAPPGPHGTPGKLRVTGGRAWADADTNRFDTYATANVALGADQYAEADVVIGPGGISNSYVGVVVRAHLTAPYSWYKLETWGSTTQVRLLTLSNGLVVSEREATTPQALAPNTTHRFRLEARGTTLRAYVDSVLVLDVIDTTLTGGGAGIELFSSTTSIDNLAVGDLPPTPPTSTTSVPPTTAPPTTAAPTTAAPTTAAPTTAAPTTAAPTTAAPTTAAPTTAAPTTAAPTTAAPTTAAPTTAAPTTTVPTPPSSGLVTNGSFETVSPTNAALPLGWNQGRWGTNTTTFTHATGGGRTGARYARVSTTSFTSGDAKWWFDTVPVQPNTLYTFGDWYRSTVATQVTVAVTLSNGSTSWLWLGSPAASSGWTNHTRTFTTPSNAVSVTVFHILAAVGTLDVDDVVLYAGTTPPTPTTTVPTTVPPTTAAPTTAAPTTAAPTTAAPTTAAPTTAAPTTAAPTTAAPTTAAPTTAAPTTTTVPPAPSGLVPNGSVETVSPTNAALPLGWNQGRWGTNTATFTHGTGGGHTGSRFTRVALTSYTSGDAKWWFEAVPVQPNTLYTFSNWYRSTAVSQVLAAVTLSDGSTTWLSLRTAPVAASWTSQSATFTTPANATAVTVFHLIAAVGTLDTDDTLFYAGTTPPAATTTTVAPTTTAAPTTTVAPTTTAPPTTAPPVAASTQQVDVGLAGAVPNGDASSVAISGNGRYVAFASTASNLVGSDTNSASDVFVRDLQTGTTTRVSLTAAGGQATGGSYEPAISDDGRYVVFHSDAALTADDGAGLRDVYVRDTVNNTTTLVSAGVGGVAPIGGVSTWPSISDDGRYVAFNSTATNLVAGDTNGHIDVFVRDLQNSSTVRASVSTAGAQGSGGFGAFDGHISGDGRYVVFTSNETNVVTGVTLDVNVRQVYRRDLVLGTTILVSTNVAGQPSSGGSSDDPSISSDGRYVMWHSTATDLVAGDVNGAEDVFRRDVTGNATVRAGQFTDEGTGEGGNQMISANGQYVVFSSGQAGGQRDAFRWNSASGSSLQVSVASNGTPATGGNSRDAVISNDGSRVAFLSGATNLGGSAAAGSTNVYVRTGI